MSFWSSVGDFLHDASTPIRWAGNQALGVFNIGMDSARWLFDSNMRRQHINPATSVRRFAENFDEADLSNGQQALENVASIPGVKQLDTMYRTYDRALATGALVTNPNYEGQGDWSRSWRDATRTNLGNAVAMNPALTSKPGFGSDLPSWAQSGAASVPASLTNLEQINSGKKYSIEQINDMVAASGSLSAASNIANLVKEIADPLIFAGKVVKVFRIAKLDRPLVAAKGTTEPVPSFESFVEKEYGKVLNDPDIADADLQNLQAQARQRYAKKYADAGSAGVQRDPSKRLRQLVDELDRDGSGAATLAKNIAEADDANVIRNLAAVKEGMGPNGGMFAALAAQEKGNVDGVKTLLRLAWGDSEALDTLTTLRAHTIQDLTREEDTLADLSKPLLGDDARRLFAWEDHRTRGLAKEYVDSLDAHDPDFAQVQQLFAEMEDSRDAINRMNMAESIFGTSSNITASKFAVVENARMGRAERVTRRQLNDQSVRGETAPGRWASFVYRKSHLSRPVRFVTWLGMQQFPGTIALKGPEAANASYRFSDWLNGVSLYGRDAEGVGRKKELMRMFDGATTESERYAVLQAAEERVLSDISTHYGLSAEDGQWIYDQHRRSREGAMRQFRETGYMVDGDEIVKSKQMETHLRDSLPLVDVSLYEALMQRNAERLRLPGGIGHLDGTFMDVYRAVRGGSRQAYPDHVTGALGKVGDEWVSLGGAKDRLIELNDVFQGLWKPSALVFGRLGYPMRNVAELNLRSLAYLGAAASTGWSRSIGRAMQNASSSWVYAAGPMLSGSSKKSAYRLRQRVVGADAKSYEANLASLRDELGLVDETLAGLPQQGRDPFDAQGFLSEQQVLHHATDVQFDTFNPPKDSRLVWMAESEGEAVDYLPSHLKNFKDTRGEGLSFHGTVAPFDLQPEVPSNSSNLFGDGLYTTESFEVSSDYRVKNAGPGQKQGNATGVVYATQERQPVKFFDLESDLGADDPDAKLVLETLMEQFDLIPDRQAREQVLEDFGHLKDGAEQNGKAFSVSHLRSNLQGANRDDWKRVFNKVKEALAERGYGGFTHVGGGRYRRPSGLDDVSHQVRVYWDPYNQLDMELVDTSNMLDGVHGNGRSVAAPVHGRSVDFTDQPLPTGVTNYHGVPDTRAMLDWMRDNDVARVKVADPNRPHLFSWLVDPRWIAHGGNDVTKNAEGIARARQRSTMHADDLLDQRNGLVDRIGAVEADRQRAVDEMLLLEWRMYAMPSLQRAGSPGGMARRDKVFKGAQRELRKRSTVVAQLRSERAQLDAMGRWTTYVPEERQLVEYDKWGLHANPDDPSVPLAPERMIVDDDYAQRYEMWLQAAKEHDERVLSAIRTGTLGKAEGKQALVSMRLNDEFIFGDGDASGLAPTEFAPGGQIDEFSLEHTSEAIDPDLLASLQDMDRKIGEAQRSLSRLQHLYQAGQGKRNQSTRLYDRNGTVIVAGQVMADAFNGPSGEQARKLSSSAGTWDTMIGDSARGIERLNSGKLAYDYGQVNPSEGVVWYDTLSDLINKQWKNDALALRVLQGQPHGSLVRWLRDSGDGRAYMRRMQINALDVDRHVERIVGEVDAYTGMNQGLQQLILDRAVSPDDIKAFLPEGDPRRVAIHGPVRVSDESAQQLSMSSAAGKVAAGYEGMVSRLFRVLGSIPEDKLGRHPFYARRFAAKEYQLTQQRLTHLKERGRDFTDADAKMVREQSHKFALDETKKWLYTLDTMSNLSGILRFIAPFAPAWENTMRTWVKLGYLDPSIVPIADKIINLPNRIAQSDDEGGRRPLVQVTDADGKPVESVHGIGSNQYVTLNFPDWLAERVGVPGWSIQKGSANVVLQGNQWWNPGFGPQLQIPATMYAKYRPDLYEGTDVSFDGQKVRLPGLKVILPYLTRNGADVSTADAWWSMLTPNVARRLSQAASSGALGEALRNIGDEGGAPQLFDALGAAADLGKSEDFIDNDPTFNKVLWEVYRKEWTDFYDGRRPGRPSEKELVSRARTVQMLQLWSAVTMPAQGSPVSRYQFYIDEFRRMQAEDPATATDKFLGKHGEEFFMYTVSGSQNDTGMAPTDKVYRNFVRDPKMVEKMASIDPKLVGVMLNEPGGTFSDAYYQWQMNRPIGSSGVLMREQMSAKELFEKAQEKLAWRKYFKMSDMLDVELTRRAASGGSRSMLATSNADLAEQKKEYVDYLGEWSEGWLKNQRFDLQKEERIISGLRTLASDRKFREYADSGSSASMWESVDSYLRNRVTIGNELLRRKAAGGGATLEADSNADLRLAWDDYVNGLIDYSPQFTYLYRFYLSGDTFRSRGRFTGEDRTRLVGAFQ